MHNRSSTKGSVFVYPFLPLCVGNSKLLHCENYLTTEMRKYNASPEWVSLVGEVLMFPLFVDLSLFLKIKIYNEQKTITHVTAEQDSLDSDYTSQYLLLLYH